MCGGGEGLVVDLVRGVGVRGCAWRGHVARRLHKDGALNAADKICEVRNVVRAMVLAHAIDTRGRTR